MSSSSQSAPSMSATAPQSNCFDPLDSLIDFSEYETVSYQSPSVSPTTSKTQFTRQVSATPTMNNTMAPSSSQQTLSGPSHQYELYKQQTGIPTGAVANTLAVNQGNAHINPSYDYYSSLNQSDDFVDFGTAPQQTPYNGPADTDMDGDFYYQQQSSQFVNPNAIEAHMPPPSNVLPTQTSNVGRLWPGMHQQQAALAKAQAQQRQQQQIIQQQRQQSMPQQQRPQPRRSNAQPADPIVEEKISQLLNSMRQSSVVTIDGDDMNNNSNTMSHVHRMRKEEEDMDEDERLLASEEGKKLSSKERRQLRNKVSARAFRSRRKEYIGQLEGEIAGKVNENSDLRAQNRALIEENNRLSDLTRMLLSSPAFSGFLNDLSANGNALPQQSAPAPVEQRQVEQRQQQVRKDVNPYAAQQHMQQQHIGMTMIPEQAMDFSMLDLNADGGYSYQPQVFAVPEMPEGPAIDASFLAGKSVASEHLESEASKVEMPIMRLPVTKEAPAAITPVVDEEFDSDPAFALFNDAPAPSSSSELDMTAIFGGIESEKALARYELVDATPSEASGILAMARVQRICAGMEDTVARLEAMTINM